MSVPMSLIEMAQEARLEAMQYRAWAEAKRNANRNPRSIYRWPEHDIDQKDQRAAMFDRMADRLEEIAPMESRIVSALEAA